MNKRENTMTNPETAYLVAYGATPAERFRAVAYSNRAAAVAAAADQRIVPVGDCAVIVQTAADVSFSKRLLTLAYNALTGESVARFKTRGAGVDRLMAALARLVSPMVITTSLEHEAAAADRYFATASLGMGKYDVRNADTLDKARELAKVIYVDRPIAIYAERGGHQVHVENYEPRRDMEEVNQASEEGQTKTVRQPKIGEFHQARADSNLGRVYTAIVDGSYDLMGVAETVNMTKEVVEAALKVGRRTHGIDFRVDDNGFLSLILPDGQTSAIKERVPKAKPVKKTNGRTRDAMAPGEFKPVHDGTKLAKNLRTLLGGGWTVDTFIQEMDYGPRPAEKRDVSFLLRRSLTQLHGIRHEISESGLITIIPPEGKTVDDLIVASSVSK